MRKNMMTLLFSALFALTMTVSTYAWNGGEELAQDKNNEEGGTAEGVTVDNSNANLEKGHKYVTFTVTTEEPRINGDTIILLYSGDKTDVYVELSAVNDYSETQSLPQGKYVLTDVISTSGNTYDFNLGNSFTVFSEDVEIGISEVEMSTAEELMRARAQDQTDRNEAREKAIREGSNNINKVGGKVSATEDSIKKGRKTAAAVVAVIVLIVSASVTVSCVLRKSRRDSKDKEQKVI